MAGFVQIIEFQTSRIDEIKDLGDKYRSARMAGQQSERSNAPLRVTLTADRDRPGFYLNIVEFESAEVAMENSARPDTSDFAAEMMKLCDAPPRFYNLDLIDTWSS